MRFAAAPRRPISPPAISRLRTVRDAQISPDGGLVAYVLHSLGTAPDLPPEQVRLADPSSCMPPGATAPGETARAGAGSAVTDNAVADPLLGVRLATHDTHNAAQTNPRWRPGARAHRTLAYLSRPNGGAPSADISLTDVPFGVGHPASGSSPGAVGAPSSSAAVAAGIVAKLAQGAGAFEWSPRGTYLSAVARWAGLPTAQPPTPTPTDRDAPVVVGDEAPPAPLWVIDPDANAAPAPIPAAGLHIRRYAWSPDERFVAVVGTPSPLDACGALYVFPAPPPGAQQDAPPHHDEPPSPEGPPLYDEPPRQDGQGTAPEALLQLHDPAVALAWSPDRRTIALCTREHAPGSGQLTLVPVSPATGLPDGDSRAVLPDLPASVEWIAFHPDGRLLLAALWGVRVGLYAIRTDAGGGDTLETLVAPSAFGSGSLGSGSFTSFGVSLDAAGESFASTSSGPREPGDVVVGRLRTAPPESNTLPEGHGPPESDSPTPRLRPTLLRVVTRANPEVRRFRFADTRVIRWPASDGLEIEGLLLTPPDPQSGPPFPRPHPTVLELHGGPRRSWWDTCQLTEGWAGMLAARGYVVLLPNPRGSSGYGAAFIRANAGDLGGADLADCLSGLDLLVQQGIADPQRMGVAGWSYGGYLAAWAITQTDRFRAAVVGAAITDRVSWAGLSPPMAAEWGRAFWGDPLASYRHTAHLAARSPITHVQRVKTPTLLLHGGSDSKIPPSQADELYRALVALGVPVRYVRYPGAGHVLSSARHISDSLHEVQSWLDRHLLDST